MLRLSRALFAGAVRDLATFGPAGAQTIVAVSEDGMYLWPAGTDRVTRLADPVELDRAHLFKVCTYQVRGAQQVTGSYTDGHWPPGTCHAARSPRSGPTTARSGR